jgi:hypothetical protein
MADGGMAGSFRGRPGPFRSGELAACPDCAATHWHVGRRSAECATCGAALPLAEGEPLGAAGARSRKGGKGSFRPAGKR